MVDEVLLALLLLLLLMLLLGTLGALGLLGGLSRGGFLNLKAEEAHAPWPSRLLPSEAILAGQKLQRSIHAGRLSRGSGQASDGNS